MSDDQPTQPLTDAELAAIEQRHDNAHEDMRSYSAETLRLQDTARDIPRLIAEVDRLQAENVAVKTQRDQFQKMMNSTVIAGVTIDGERLDALRERDALRAQLDAARKALFDDAFEGHAQRYRALARALGGTDA